MSGGLLLHGSRESTQGFGAVLLLPVALIVQVGLATLGLAVYAVVFTVAGIAGLVELGVVRRLPRPGRVRVAARGTAPARTPETGRFIRDVAIAAFGAGFGPYLSIFSISVLGMSAGFAILLSAISAAASLAAATIVGGWLHRGSASRALRLSMVMRGGAMILGLAALPGNPVAWLVVCAVAALAASGWATGTLAANERLLRLTGGANLIGAQASFVAWSSAGVTLGQFSSASVLAVLPVGYPAFAILFTVSGLVRLVLATRVDVGPPGPRPRPASTSTSSGATPDGHRGQSRRHKPTAVSPAGQPARGPHFQWHHQRWRCAARLPPGTGTEGAQPMKIEDLEGVGPSHAEKLRVAGVATVEALLEMAGPASGRAKLAQATGIGADTLLKWTNHADLYRLTGVGSEYADLLEAAGVDSCTELARRNAANLATTLAEANAAKPLVRRVPSESVVADWIEQAKGFEKVVSH